MSFKVLKKYARYQIGVLGGAEHPIEDVNDPQRISVVPFAETPHWQEGGLYV